MKIKEVLAEAGNKPGVGYGIARGLLGAATGVAKMFDPKLGATMGAMHQASDVKAQRDAKAAELLQKRQGAKDAKTIAAQQRAAATATPSLGNTQVPVGQRLMVVIGSNTYFKGSDGVWRYIPNMASPEYFQQLQEPDAAKLDALQPNAATSVKLVPVPTASKVKNKKRRR